MYKTFKMKFFRNPFSFLDKINVWSIVQGHFHTLRNDNSKRASKGDYFTFFGIPIILASALVYFGIGLSDDALKTVITVMTVLVGLLFNVIVILFDIVRKDNSNETKNEVSKQVLSNISYSVLLSIVTILFTLLINFENCIVKTTFTWIVYFLLSHFFLTALMILKRVFKLFGFEMKTEARKK